MKNGIKLLTISLFLIISLKQIHAQAGQLDKTFGQDGIVNTIINNFKKDSHATSITIQSDGKIVAAGNIRDISEDFVVVRYNADGSLDNTFGINGIASTKAGNQDHGSASSVAIQTDGKIIAAGSSISGGNSKFTAIRYKSDGNLDESFGTDGKIETLIGNKDSFAGCVSVQNDGKILVGGSFVTDSDDVNNAIVRYKADGSLDNSFGTGGIVIIPTENPTNILGSIAIQIDGKIVVTGSTKSGSIGDPYDITVARYNLNGDLDNTFGNDGIITTSIGSSSVYAESAVIQNDGKIIVGATSDYDFTTVRYNIDGTLDNTFGTDGKIFTPIDSLSAETESVFIQNDGKIVAAGFSVGETGDNKLFFIEIRYNPDGNLDSKFGVDGISTQPINNEDEFFSLAVRNNEGIVAAGTSFDGIKYHFTLFAFDSDGSLDNSFGNNGSVTTDIGESKDFINSVALQKDANNEKIITAGKSWNGNNFDFSASRYNSDGSLDNSFGINGSITTQLGNADDFVNAVAVQDDGKIIATGSSFNGNNKVFATVRYNTDGSLDNSFGTGGKVITAFGSEDAYANSVAIQKDGKIITVGVSPSTFGINVTNHVFTLVRYNPDGTLDSDFGANGIITKRINILYSEATSIEIQEDGKIIAGGLSGTGGHVFALVRLNPDGKSDTTFSNDGLVTTSVGKIEGQTLNSSISAINSVSIQNDGKIIACGYCTNDVNGGTIAKDFALVRYNTDGSLDSTFGEGGIVITSLGDLDDVAYSVKVQEDGKIIAGGYTDSGNDKDFSIVRYNNDGIIDSTFGINGIEINNIGASNNFIKSIVLQKDGNIIAAGYSANNDSSNVVNVIARYLANAQTSGIKEKNKEEIPFAFKLMQNYPNPFNPSTKIDYTIPAGTQHAVSVQLKVYDILGREVATLVNEEKPAGNYKVTFDAKNLASGIYFYRLKAGNYISVKKMILLR